MWMNKTVFNRLGGQVKSIKHFVFGLSLNDFSRAKLLQTYAPYSCIQDSLNFAQSINYLNSFSRVTVFSIFAEVIAKDNPGWAVKWVMEIVILFVFFSINSTTQTIFRRTIISRARIVGGQWLCDYTIYGNKYTIYGLI